MLKSFPQCALHIARERGTSLYNFKQARLFKTATESVDRKGPSRRGVGWILGDVNKRQGNQINTVGRKRLKSSFITEPVQVGPSVIDGENSNNNSASNSGSIKKKNIRFEEHLPKSEVDRGLENGTIVKGHFFVLPSSSRTGFVKTQDNLDVIHIINEGWHRYKDTKAVYRARALPGDLVAVQLRDRNSDGRSVRKYDELRADLEEDKVGLKEENEKGTLKERCLEGKIVAVLKKLHPRTCTGYIENLPSPQHLVKFISTDKSLPSLNIEKSELPPEFFYDNKVFSRELFTARIGEWRPGSLRPEGKLVQIVGDDGNLDTEEENLLNARSKSAEQNEEHLPKNEVESGLANGTILKGHFFVPVNNDRLGFVKTKDGLGDILVVNEGWNTSQDHKAVYRARALPGDLVAVQLCDSNCDGTSVRKNNELRAGLEEENKSETWKDRYRKGKIVAVLQKLHPRTCTGYIDTSLAFRNKDVVRFLVTDKNLPNLNIHSSEMPPGSFDDIQVLSGKLFAARIGDWKPGSVRPVGKLEHIIGDCGNLETEVERLLITYKVDTGDFTEESFWNLPEETKGPIPSKEMTYRRDFRDKCIFTIDPPTAMDIDDALSCEEVGNGLYRVGVHIADVSHFVKEDSALDEVAKKRTTSYYLMDKAIPMLPKLLSEDLCSLNPDVDRLAFSVEWIMTGDGTIKSQWFGRSIIKSCVKLSYDHAQLCIDNPNKKVDVQELPPISKPFKPEDIALRIRNLHKIAVKLRTKRFDTGALQLDKMKLKFTLCEASKYPLECSVYEQKASNKLIEEFMLLANMTVARIIKEAFPYKAVLRCHEPPKPKDLIAMKNSLKKLGIDIDVSSAGTIQKTLDTFRRGNEVEEAEMQIILSYIVQPIMLARYFCAGTKDESEYFHYALNVPLYTHFTSPIRRYPDILVHRLLGAVLGYCDPPRNTNLTKILIHANDRRLASKRLEDRLTDVYFAFYLKMVGPIREKVMVTAVAETFMKVFVMKYGVKCRILYKNLPLKHTTGSSGPIIVWEGDENSQTREQEVKTFAILDCILEYATRNHAIEWKANVVRPSDE